MSRIILNLVPAALLLMTLPMQSRASLVGSAVNGSLTFSGDPSNYFDPAYGFVPSGTLNSAGSTVTISANDVEFGYDDGVANLITADFAASQLIITDVVESSGPNNGFRLVFKDDAFNKMYLIHSDALSLVSNYSALGNVFTLTSFSGDVSAGQTFTDTFTVMPVPEPGMLRLLFLGVFFAGGALPARRLRRKVLNSCPRVLSS